MSVADEFDSWAADGRDREMESRHWHTAKHALSAMPVQPGETVLDLGTGSGYALRALADVADIGRGIGVDASGEMLRNAASYTDDTRIEFIRGAFESLPIDDDQVDHVFSMEAFYYARPHEALAEIHRVLRPGGTFHCAVNFFEESEQTHEWADRIGVEMTRWSQAEYQSGFRQAGFAVAHQRCIPDEEIEIPPADAFPTESWDTREAMVDRYRRWGTLVTVGVATSSG